MKPRFVGKTVIVTGASSGIGAATAEQFAEEGACVVLVARTREKLEAVAARIGPDKTLVVPMDVTNWHEIAAVLDKAWARFGGIHILINNAGYNSRGPVEDRGVDDLTRIIDINLRAPVAWCRMVLPYIRGAGGGAIVNVASLAGRVPIAGIATYSATKFGLRAFSLALTEELRGTGITVSVVSPGTVDTEMFIDDIDRMPDQIFAPRVSQPEAVAACILACADDGRAERTIPPLGGIVTTFGYVCPLLRRKLGPLIDWVGRRHKERFIRQRGP